VKLENTKQEYLKGSVSKGALARNTRARPAYTSNFDASWPVLLVIRGATSTLTNALTHLIAELFGNYY
jgi:hypothetical protein